MAQTETARPLAYSIPDAARMVGGFSRAYIYELAKRGDLKITKIGARSVILVSELERFLAESPTLGSTK